MRFGIVGFVLCSLLLTVNHAGAVPPAPWEADELMGQPAPPFTLPDLHGKQISLEDFRGKALLLNFWATWCPPCKKEMPSLNALLKDHGDRGVAVLSIAADRSLKRLETFVEDVPLDFPVLRDPEGTVSERYKVYALPTTFLVGYDGTLVEKFLGERNWNSEEIVQKILKVVPPPP